MNLRKKSLVSMLMAIVLVYTMSVSLVSAAASTYGPFPVRSEDSGDWDVIWVELNTGVTTFSLTNYTIKGIHTGEQAAIKWTLYNHDGDFVYSWNVVGDRNDTQFDVSGLEAGAMYQLVWEATTNNDMDGGTKIKVDGRAYQ